VAFLEAYFDESYSDEAPHILAVAGYLFEKERCLEFDTKMKALLEQYGLPYFHMVDCAHGNQPFKNLDKTKRIEVATRVISLIREHAMIGVAFGLDQDDYRTTFPEGFALRGLRYDDPYSYCCHTCIEAIQGWLDRHGIAGKVSYFFESGHASAPKAQTLMDQIFKERNLRSDYRYAAHGFVPKTHRPVQSADMLAWLHYTDLKNILAKWPRPKRKDFVALIDNWPVETKFVGKEQLGIMRRQIDDFLRGLPLITGSWGNFSPFVATWMHD